MEEGKQVEMELSYTYPVEQMGALISPEILPHTVHLSESFLRDKLRVSGWLDERRLLRKEPEEVTNIGCPFCRKGSLKLIMVEPVYSGGLSPTPSSMRHVANKYEYVCSTDECDGRFSGTVSMDVY